MYEIEKNVPLPNSGRQRIYPFNDMQVGDSFTTDSVSVRAAASWFGIRNGMKFTIREGDKGFRVWRTA